MLQDTRNSNESAILANVIQSEEKEQELAHHREETESHYRERHTPEADTLTILSDNDNCNNSISNLNNNNNNNNNNNEKHKSASEKVVKSQTTDRIAPEKITSERKTDNAANFNDKDDDMDNIKRPHCRHGIVEDDEMMQVEKDKMRYGSVDIDGVVENNNCSGELYYKSDALLRRQPCRCGRRRLNNVNNLPLQECLEEEEEEEEQKQEISQFYESHSTNKDNKNEREMETSVETSHLIDQQEVVNTDEGNNTNIKGDDTEFVEKELEKLESSAKWDDYFTSDAVQKTDCTTYTELYIEKVSNVKMSMYKVIHTYQLLHEAMLSCLKEREWSTQYVEELSEWEEKSKVLTLQWCASYVSTAVQLQTFYESLSLMPVALSLQKNKSIVNAQRFPCVGVSNVHVDDTYRIIVQLQVEPFTISLNDLVAFHVRPFSINEFKSIVRSIILHMLNIADYFVLHEQHVEQQLEREESSICEKNSMSLMYALENIVRQLHGGNILFSSHDGSVTFTVLPELCLHANGCFLDNDRNITAAITRNKVESNTDKLSRWKREELMQVLQLPLCLSNMTSQQAHKLQALVQDLKQIQETNSEGNNNITCKICGNTSNETNTTINLESIARCSIILADEKNIHSINHVDADCCKETSTLQQSKHLSKLNEIVHQIKHAIGMISLSLLLGYPLFHKATLENVIDLLTSNNNNININNNNSIDGKDGNKYINYINKLIDTAISFRIQNWKYECNEKEEKLENVVNSTLANKSTKECENEEEQRQCNEFKLFILSCLETCDNNECEQEQEEEVKCTMKMVYDKVHHLLRHPFFRKLTSIHVQKARILSPLENTEEEITAHNADDDDDDECDMGKEKELLPEVHDAVHRIIYPIYTYLSKIKERVNRTIYSSSSSYSQLESCFYQVRAHRNSIFAARSTFVEQCCAIKHDIHNYCNYWWPVEISTCVANPFEELQIVSSLGIEELEKNQNAIAKHTITKGVRESVRFINNAEGITDYITHTLTIAEQSHKTFCITRKQAEQLLFCFNCSNNDHNNAVRHTTTSYIDTIVLSHLTSCHVQILYPVKNILLCNLCNCVICVGPSRVCYIGHYCETSVLHVASAYLYTADNLLIKHPSPHHHQKNVIDVNEMENSHNSVQEDHRYEWHWMGNVILDFTGQRVALGKTSVLPFCLTYPGLSADCGMVKMKPVFNFCRYNSEVIHRTKKTNATLQLLPFHGLINSVHDYPFAHMLSYASQSFVHLNANDKDTCYYYNSELHNKDIYISNIHGSCTCTSDCTDCDKTQFPFIIILDTVREVNVTDCSHCTLVVIGSLGSVSLHSCHDMYCIFVSRESVVSECYNLIIHAFVTEFLLMEECHDAAVIPLYVECPWFDRIMSAIVAESYCHDNEINSHKDGKEKKDEKNKEEESSELEKEDVESISSSIDDSIIYSSTANEIKSAYETRSVLLLNVLLQAYSFSESSRGVSFVECVDVELYTSEFYRLHEYVLPVMIIIPFTVVHANDNIHIKPKNTSSQSEEFSAEESFNSHDKSECNVGESISAKQIVITHQMSNLTPSHLSEMPFEVGEVYACTLFREWCCDNDVEYDIAFEKKEVQECLYFHINSTLTLSEEDIRNDNHRNRHRHRNRNRNRNREVRRYEFEHQHEEEEEEWWKQESTFALTDTSDEKDNEDDDNEEEENKDENEERYRLIHASVMKLVEYKVPHICFSNLLGVHLYRPAHTLLPFTFNLHGHTVCDVTLDNITAHETWNSNNNNTEKEMPNYIIITQPLRHVLLRNVNGPIHVLFTAVSHVTMMDCQEITLYCVCQKMECINCHSCHVALHTNSSPEFINCTFMEYSVWNVALDDMHLTSTVDNNNNNNKKEYVFSSTTFDANTRRRLYESEKAKVSLYEAVQEQYDLLSIDVNVNLVHRAIIKNTPEHLYKPWTKETKTKQHKYEKEVVDDEGVAAMDVNRSQDMVGESVREENMYQISPWPFQHTIHTHHEISNNDNNVLSLYTLYDAIVYTSPLPLTEILFECCETKTNWQDHTPYAKKRNRPIINSNNNNKTSANTEKKFTSLMCAMPEVMYRRVEQEQIAFRQRCEEALNAECNTDVNHNEECQDEETSLYVKTSFNARLCKALDLLVKHMKEEQEQEKETSFEPLSHEPKEYSLKEEINSHGIEEEKYEKSKHVDPYKINEEEEEEEEEEECQVNDNSDPEQITLLREVSGGVNDEGGSATINKNSKNMLTSAENESPYENTLSYSPPSQLQEHKMPIILHKVESSVNEPVEVQHNNSQESEKEHVSFKKEGNDNIIKKKERIKEEEILQNQTEEHDMCKHEKAINTASLETEKETEDKILTKSNVTSTNERSSDDNKQSSKGKDLHKENFAELHENDPSHTEQNYPSTETDDTNAVSVSTATKECFQTGIAIAAATHDTILKETSEEEQEVVATPLPTNERFASPFHSRHSSSSSSSSSSSLVSTEFSNLVQPDATHDKYTCQYMRNWHDSNVSFSTSSTSSSKEEVEESDEEDDMKDEYGRKKTPSSVVQNEKHTMDKEQKKTHHLRGDAKSNNNNNTSNNRHRKKEEHVDGKTNTYTYQRTANDLLSPFASSSLSSSSSRPSSSAEPTSLSTPPASTHKVDVCRDGNGMASKRHTNNREDRDELNTEDEEGRSSDEERLLHSLHSTENNNEHVRSTHHQQHNRVIPLCTSSTEQLLRHALLNHEHRNHQQHHQEYEPTFTTNNHDHEEEDEDHNLDNNEENDENNECDNHINHATHRSHQRYSIHDHNNNINDIANRSRLLQVFEEVVIARAAYRAFSAQLEQTHALLERIRRVSRLLEEQRRLREIQHQSSDEEDEQWSSESEEQLHN